MQQLNTIRHHYRVERKEIAYLRFIFEAHDGLAVITTEDRETGIISVNTAPGREAEVEHLISGLKREIMIEPIVG